MSDIFETCLEHVMDMNCVIEGTFMAKRLEKIGKISDDDLRKTISYTSVYNALVQTNGKNLKPFKEKLKSLHYGKKDKIHTRNASSHC